jgi:hypothetical protein
MVPPTTEAKDLAGFRDTLAEGPIQGSRRVGEQGELACKEGNQVATRLWEAPGV